jgi:hypothetical protein
LFITTTIQLLAEVIALLGTGAPFTGAKMALFTNAKNPSPGDVLADYTITDFAGLTNTKSVVWGTPFINDLGQAEVRGGSLNWASVTAPPDAVTAYGWVELDTTGATVLRAERFAVPYSFARAGQVLTLVPRLVLGNT